MESILFTTMPSVQETAWLTTQWWVYMADVLFALAISLNIYTLCWALEGWGFADYQWARNMFGIVGGWKEMFFMIVWVANILEDFQGALGALSVD
jgi:hypothetical protein